MSYITGLDNQGIACTRRRDWSLLRLAE